MMRSDVRPKCSAIAAGLVCLDFFPGLAGIDAADFAREFRPGNIIEMERTMLSSGGSVSNTGLALYKLGVEMNLVGKIGADPFGQTIQVIYRGIHPALADHLIIDPDHMTGHSFVIEPRGNDRSFLYHSGANDFFTAEDVTELLLQSAGLFHFGYPPAMASMFADGGSELLRLFEKARRYGITTSLDTSKPDRMKPSGQADWVRIFRKVLPSVDCFLPSFEEILFMLDRNHYDELAGRTDLIEAADPALLHQLGDQLLDMGAAMILIKLGHRGLYLRTADRQRLVAMGRARPENLAQWEKLELTQTIFPVTVAGTTGAGDTAIAGFLAGLLRDVAPQEALKAAAACGSCCCEQPDALSGLLDWAALCSRINGGWKSVQEEKVCRKTEK